MCLFFIFLKLHNFINERVITLKRCHVCVVKSQSHINATYDGLETRLEWAKKEAWR